MNERVEAKIAELAHRYYLPGSGRFACSAALREFRDWLVEEAAKVCARNFDAGKCPNCHEQDAESIRRTLGEPKR